MENDKTAFSRARFEKEENELKELEAERLKDQESVEALEASEELKKKGGNKEEASWAKRYADLRRKEQKLIDENKELKTEMTNLSKSFEQLKASVEGLPQEKRADPNADINELREKYPKLDALLKQTVEKEVSKFKDKISKVDELEAERENNKAVAALKALHPDFFDSIGGNPAIDDTPEFHDWVVENNFQKYMYKGNDIEKADYVITKYKIATNLIGGSKEAPKKDTKESAREAAGSVRTPSAPTLSGDGTPKNYDFTESQIAKMSMRDYEKHADAINEAQRKGRIAYGQ